MNLCRTAFLLTLTALLLAGCSRQEERRHPFFIQGSKARAEGNGAVAKEYFEKLLERRPESTAALLELAGVCDELLNDPATAAYYYNRYLAAVPDAPDADAIRQWRDAAEKKAFEAWKERFEGSAEASAADSAAEVAKLRRQVEELQHRNDLLYEELQQLQSTREAANAATPAAADDSDDDSQLPEFYVVQEGDNPSRIAQKLYGDKRKYTILLRANPQVSPTKLKPGMKLIVPKP